MAAGLVALGAAAELDLLGGDEVGAADVVPAVDDGAEGLVPGLADVEEPGAARAEEPLVRVGGDEVGVFGESGEGAERLDAVDAEGDAATAGRGRGRGGRGASRR